MSTINILISKKNNMSFVLLQKCKKCGKDFQEWSCAFCYTESILQRTQR